MALALAILIWKLWSSNSEKHRGRSAVDRGRPYSGSRIRESNRLFSTAIPSPSLSDNALMAI
jgi:hypothetical protein